ncbi:hypothetical protein [Dermatobacter hominis]|uniref:hypothetical protein n=1 Tax=Dermatobacter hominis TaxID=2884263 RepID=UPI001D0FEA3E|nr:hypothetical protein [Dermatobacter hominis]UDY36324.1 hypothetical protein LH044_02025 [Dermatobacter hominis]
MQRWQVGDVEVVRVVDADFAMPSEVPLPAWTVPAFAPSTAEHRVAFSALAVLDGDLTVVADPWLQADRDGAGAADAAGGLLDAAARAGVEPDAVDVVVATHLEGIGWATRPDEGGWRPSFPGARHVYPAQEVAAVARGEDLPGIDDFRALAALTAIEEVDGSVALTPSVAVEVSAAHSFGHGVVRIESGGELALYTGHLVIHPLQVVDPDDARFDGSAADAPLRRSLLEELAERGGTLLTTLVGGPGGGRVHRDGDGFRLEPDDLPST